MHFILIIKTFFEKKYPTPTTDRDRTVSRRSELSSRATLIGEQPKIYLVTPNNN